MPGCAPTRPVLRGLAAVALFGFTAAATSAEIEAFSPQGEVKRVRQVTARFAEQMVSFGDPREFSPFDVDCPAPGQGRWADGRNWVYDFDADLPAGIRCTFNLKPGLTTQAGRRIVDGERFAFSTGGPAIRVSEPHDGHTAIDEEQVFILGLDVPAKPETIVEHAACVADGIPERIPVRLLAGAERQAILDQRKALLTRTYQALFKDRRGAVAALVFGVEQRGSDEEKFLKLRDGERSPIVVLRCQRPLPPATGIRLVWGAGIATLTGIPSGQTRQLAFRTREAFTARFSCDRVNKDAHCIPVLPTELAFTAPVAVADARRIRLVDTDGKSRTAILNPEDEKEGFVNRLRFPAPLPENRLFKLQIPADLHDDAGRPLANAGRFPLIVRTDENPPLAKFAARFGIVERNADPGRPPLLPVTLRNVESRLAGTLASVRPAGDIDGKVVRADADTEVIGWLRRLRENERVDVRFDEQSGRAIPLNSPGLKSIFADKERGRPIRVPKPLGEKAFEVVGIPLPSPGFHVVELKSPRLGAALLGETRPYHVQAAALVTNLAVHFKQGRESSLVWVTSLDRGQPVASAEIAVRDCGGHLHFRGRTDAAGLLRIDRALPERGTLPACLEGWDRQYFVTARQGDDFSFVLSDWNEGIALWRFNLPQGAWQGHDLVHAVFDRTLLRAGETVHMKILHRRQTLAGFGRIGFTPDERLTIIHQGSNQQYPLSVTWDRDGTAVAAWKIPADAKQGSYRVEVSGPRRHERRPAGNFRVESFRVPTMRASVDGPATPLINADAAPVAVQVSYLSGGGAGGATVQLRGQIRPRTIRFPDYEDFALANGDVAAEPGNADSDAWTAGDYELAEPDNDGSGGDDSGGAESHPPDGRLLAAQRFTLDDAGAGRAVLDGLPKSATPRELVAELEYRDASGETLTTATTIPLWPAQRIVGIKPESWIAGGDQLKFQALLLGLAGRPVAGARVAVDALIREHYAYRKRLIGGFYAYDNHTEIRPLGELCAGETDSRGLLVCEVRPPAAGNLILRARTADADGNVSIAHQETWVAAQGEDLWFDASNTDRIDLLPEKKRYEPGDTARFQLRMPFRQATVLVTVEREGVMESFVRKVSRDQPVIEVPIKGQYAPNVFVSALAVRGRIGGVKPTAMADLGKPAFKMGIAEIRVGWAAHELKVKVETDRPVYKVRQPATVSVEVRRADGSLPPKGSEVALAAVDEGLLELMPNTSWQLLEAMMKRRGIEVETATAQMQVVGKRHFGRKALPAGGGGGRQSARELFDTLLFWQARVKLDDQGRARVTVPLNDSLTSFRIVAVASGDLGLFGTGAATIRSTQDLMLLSGLPLLVREQDKFSAGFTVRNASDQPRGVEVTARAGGVALEPRTLTLAPGESREVAWTVQAPLGAESLPWEVAVRTRGDAEDGDRLRTTQKVIPAVPVRTLQATLFQVEGPIEMRVALPAGAIPGRGGVHVSLRPRLAGGLAGVREYMTHYPYTCLEQLVSRAIALDDPALWQATMDRLPTLIDADGLAKYFAVMRDGSDVLTAYLVAVADEAGRKIPDDARGRMQNALRAFVEGRLVRRSDVPAADLTLRKLAAIEALSRSGPVEKRWLDSLSIDPNLWPTSGVIDWLSILKRSPKLPRQAERLREAQQILRSRLNFQGTTMGFSTERSDALWWLMIDGDVNANRALLTLMDLDAWRPDVPRLVRGALGRQQQGRWHTTVANAWGSLALKKFSARFEAEPVSGRTIAALGTAQLEADWARDGDGAARTLPWTDAPATLQLAHEGGGKPWATIQSLAALPLDKPLFTGYRIDRTVRPIAQKTPGSWHRGDVARVRIEVEAQSDMTWVVVDDPIPAGATILTAGRSQPLLTTGEKKAGWVWPAFEERTFDSFRAYYRFVPKGRWVVEYTLRLNNDGDFRLPPTRAEAMYAPEMFGELPNAVVSVKP